MLTHKINPVISNGVATIGETNIIPKGIDTVSWYQTDDWGQLQKQLNNVLYFTDSPGNILIETVLAESTNDDDGT